MNNTPDTATATAPAGLTFRLETFEWQVHQGLNEEAARALVSLLQMLDRHYAQWGDGFSARAPGLTAEEL
ncbi:TPA: cobalt ABC transporter permease, partial [Escherichia coli]|nr:cobalt ABC transporter permease [Escherichia coli]